MRPGYSTAICPKKRPPNVPIQDLEEAALDQLLLGVLARIPALGA